jgi:hypothetical protein
MNPLKNTHPDEAHNRERSAARSDACAFVFAGRKTASVWPENALFPTTHPHFLQARVQMEQRSRAVVPFVGVVGIDHGEVRGERPLGRSPPPRSRTLEASISNAADSPAQCRADRSYG